MICFGLLVVNPAARGDGGTLRVSQSANGVTVTVFTSPTIPRAGTVDVSVLLQDETQRQTLFDAPVTVRLAQGKLNFSLPATHGAATNKLFQAAHFDGIEAGPCKVVIELRGKQVAAFEMEVAPALPNWVDFAWWVCWPGVVVGLFGIHQMLARRR
jgi:hypothetical protein